MVLFLFFLDKPLVNPHSIVSFKMLSQLISVASLLGASSALAVAKRDTASYYYVPVEFAYGGDSRVTANLTYGSAANATAVKTVMDTGSADFWVRILIQYTFPLLTRSRFGRRAQFSTGAPIILATLETAI